jgi:UDP:flavonoid glycosyltransferase YjiC (YdhE family)
LITSAARAAVDETFRPRVLIAGSTETQNQTGLLRRVERAVASLNVATVVTAGAHVEVGDLPASDHARVVAAASHDTLMREVSAA